jgi:predicted aldo/keto reductase-like oxidoreductase
VGLALRKRRSECFLATKCHVRDGEGAAATIRESLGRLGTDRVDLLLFHHVQADGELDRILAPGALADGLLWDHPEQALRYAWSLPVDVVAAGFNTMEMLRTDLEIAERFVPMGEGEKGELFRVSPVLGDSVCRLCGKRLPCP